MTTVVPIRTVAFEGQIIQIQGKVFTGMITKLS